MMMLKFPGSQPLPILGAALVGLLAAAVLVLGWGMGQIELARFGTDFPAMVPSTALLLLVAALAVLTNPAARNSAAGRHVRNMSSTMIATIAAANLWIAMTSSFSGIDQAIWPGNSDFANERMSPATSVSFLLLAVGIWASGGSSARSRLAVYVSTFGLLLSALALLVYGFDADSLVSVGIFSTLSLPTAIGFLLLFVAILSVNRDASWVNTLVGDGRGSNTARRILPMAIGIPLLLTLAVHLGNQAKLFDLNFQLTLLALGNAVVLTVVVLRDARFNNLLQIEGWATSNALELSRAKEAAQRLSREKAEADARSRSKFLANMSHEIRTPMNGVLGFAELLANSDLNPEQRRYADLILESGDTMLRLINDILDMSKIEADRMALAEEPVDIHHLARSTARLMHAAAVNKGIVLKVDIIDGTPRGFVGDSLRIRQILTNIIGNAVKFTERGGVYVSLSHGDEGIEILVRDTGIGIARDRQDHIFEQFAQADESTSRDFGGSGLGLAISKRLVELMDGHMTLESRIGEGTTVGIVLPLAVAAQELAPAAEQAETAADSEQGDWQDCRVLIAEDNEINQILVTRMVESLGAQVTLAADGLSAVETVKRSAQIGCAFDLVLMDVQMPELDGIAAAMLIRESFGAEQLPIVALTANAFSSDIEQCLEAGMQAHLAKPVKIQDLKRTFVEFLPSTPPTEQGGAACKAAAG